MEIKIRKGEKNDVTRALELVKELWYLVAGCYKHFSIW